MARKTKEEAARTREQLLEAALDVFTEKGYARATLSDIARRAGCTRGAVYHHFRDKADVFVALADELEARAGVDDGALEGIEVRSLDDLSLVLADYLHILAGDEQYRRFYHMAYYATEWSEELEPVLGRGRAQIRRMLDAMATWLGEIQLAGGLRDDVAPRRAALAIGALTEGVISLWFFDPQAFRLAEDGPAMVDDLMRSYRPDAG